MNPYILVILWNINGLNTQWNFLDCHTGKIKAKSEYCLQEAHFQYKATEKLKVKENDFPCK